MCARKKKRKSCCPAKDKQLLLSWLYTHAQKTSWSPGEEQFEKADLEKKKKLE